jgi:hypothetical protein
MSNKPRVILALVLAGMAGMVGALAWFKQHQVLGQPGIRAVAIPGANVMSIDLPEHVLDYASSNLPQADLVLGYLPKDTSYAQRFYIAPDGFGVTANIILMGRDRSSIHKPDYCLAGQGYRVLGKDVVNVPIEGPPKYDLPVAKWVGSRMVEIEGRKLEIRSLYVFWFVARNRQTVSNSQRILWFYLDQLRTGVMERWAYVSFQSVCLPGQEDATFERMRKLIAASVPEFQLPPAGTTAAAAAKP